MRRKLTTYNTKIALAHRFADNSCSGRGHCSSREDFRCRERLDHTADSGHDYDELLHKMHYDDEGVSMFNMQLMNVYCSLCYMSLSKVAFEG